MLLVNTLFPKQIADTKSYINTTFINFDNSNHLKDADNYVTSDSGWKFENASLDSSTKTPNGYNSVLLNGTNSSEALTHNGRSFMCQSSSFKVRKGDDITYSMYVKVNDPSLFTNITDPMIFAQGQQPTQLWLESFMTDTPSDTEPKFTPIGYVGPFFSSMQTNTWQKFKVHYTAPQDGYVGIYLAVLHEITPQKVWVGDVELLRGTK